MLKKAVGDRLTDSQIGGLWRMADIDGDNRLNREEVWVAARSGSHVIFWGLRTLVAPSFPAFSLLALQPATQ